MKKVLFCMLVLMLFGINVNAEEFCIGKVKAMLDDPRKCGGYMGFKIDVSGSNWLCGISDNSDSLLMTAFAANKTVALRMELPVPGDCESADSYQLPIFIRVNQD